MSIGFFILMPVLNYQLLLRPGMDAAQVAFLNNLRYICQDVSMIPCAYALKHISARKALAAAALVRGLGFMLFAAAEPSVLKAAAVLTGLGGSLFFPAAMTLYLSVAESGERERAFARREMLNSLGALIGPVVCSALMGRGFERVCLVAGLLYLLCMVLSWVALPEKAPEPTKTVAPRKSVWKGLGLFMGCCALAAVWQNQQLIAMAVYARERSYAGVEWITLAAYAFMTLVQMPLSRWAAKRLDTPRTLALSVLLFAAGLAIQRYGSGVWTLYVGNLVFASGSVLFMPAKSHAFSALHGRVEAGMLVGVHGLLTSVGSMSMGAAFGVAYNGGSNGLWLALLAGSAATAAALAYAAPQEIKSHTEG